MPGDEDPYRFITYIYFAASASWTLYPRACGSLFHIDFSHEKMKIYIFNDIKADKLRYDLH